MGYFSKVYPAFYEECPKCGRDMQATIGGSWKCLWCGYEQYERPSKGKLNHLTTRIRRYAMNIDKAALSLYYKAKILELLKEQRVE